MPLSVRGGVLHLEDVPLPAIADALGTPTYVYARTAMRDRARAFGAAVAPLGRVARHFAVKANPNGAVLATLAAEGFGADVVSGGELARALAAGIAPDAVVFSGVGKTAAELTAALDAGVGRINLESEEEGRLLAELARAAGRSATAALRVNPDVGGGGHAKITTGSGDTKFGVPIDGAAAVFGRLSALPGLRLDGLAVHIGSQLLDLDPFARAFARVGELLAELRGAGRAVDFVDLGGGLGVAADGRAPPSFDDYAALVARVTRGWDVVLAFEPGRCLVADAGVLLARVVRVKGGADGEFAVLDAGMNDLLRPALYDATHAVRAVRPRAGEWLGAVVGPVCETGDLFRSAARLTPLAAGDLVVIEQAGAYGASMASTYNSRPLPAEAMVERDRWATVRDRGTPADLTRGERGWSEG